jgi:hypothetical protein
MFQEIAKVRQGQLTAGESISAEEKRQLLHRVELTQHDVPARQSLVEQFKPANDTKKILLDESDPSKFVIIGTGLSAK